MIIGSLFLEFGEESFCGGKVGEAGAALVCEDGDLAVLDDHGASAAADTAEIAGVDVQAGRFDEIRRPVGEKRQFPRGIDLLGHFVHDKPRNGDFTLRKTYGSLTERQATISTPFALNASALST